MACELWLVRHGQAAFATDDYDRLTELGWQQARWLGQHLARRGVAFERVSSGRLRRQRETAEAMSEALGLKPDDAPGLEEYDADAILSAYGSAPNSALDRRAYFRRLRLALLAWSAGELAETPESWQEFAMRTRAAADKLAKRRTGRVLAASSGGAISMIVSQVLDFPPERMIELNLQMRNTGITRLVFTDAAVYLNMFNAIPHLELPGRAHAETYS